MKYSWSKNYFSTTYKSLKTVIKKIILGFPGGAVVKNPPGIVVKNPPANAGDMGSSPGPGGSHMPRSN